jgi:hypothetical protein
MGGHMGVMRVQHTCEMLVSANDLGLVTWKGERSQYLQLWVLPSSLSFRSAENKRVEFHSICSQLDVNPDT